MGTKLGRSSTNLRPSATNNYRIRKILKISNAFRHYGNAKRPKCVSSTKC